LVPTNAGPVEVRVVAVVLVELVVVEVALGVVEVALDELLAVVLVLLVVELVELALELDDALTVVVCVTVTVTVELDPQPASRAAAVRPRARAAALGRVFGKGFVQFPFAIPAASGYLPPRRERERWPVEQRRTQRRCSTHRRRSSPQTPLAVVTISSAYGALGGEVGRAVAAALDVPFLDRAIPVEVAEKLAVPLEEAETRDEALAGFFERLLGTFVIMGGVYGGALPPVTDVPDEAAFRAATEQIIRDRAASGAAVILGRAGMIVLADQPHVLRVRLSGPLGDRIEQAMARYGLTREQARQQERENDGARTAWVQRFYGRDVADPSLYDLVINATKLGVEQCVELIVAAAGMV
jgi:hypothetical protein